MGGPKIFPIPPKVGKISRSNHIGKLRSRISISSSARRINPLNSPFSSTILRKPEGTGVIFNCRKLTPSPVLAVLKE